MIQYFINRAGKGRPDPSPGARAREANPAAPARTPALYRVISIRCSTNWLKSRMRFPKMALRDTIEAFTRDVYGQRLTFEHD